MTNIVSGYSFMDLLKDKGIAPKTDVNSNDMVSIFNGVFSKLSLKIEAPIEHHDFMDLMHDKGFVPTPSNDNDLNIQVA